MKAIKQENHTGKNKIDPLLKTIIEEGFNVGDSAIEAINKIGAECYVMGIRSVELEFWFLYDSEEKSKAEEEPHDFEIRLTTDDDDILSINLFDAIVQVLEEGRKYKCGPSKKDAASMLELMATKLRKL